MQHIPVRQVDDERVAYLSHTIIDPETLSVMTLAEEALSKMQDAYLRCLAVSHHPDDCDDHHSLAVGRNRETEREDLLARTSDVLDGRGII